VSCALLMVALVFCHCSSVGSATIASAVFCLCKCGMHGTFRLGKGEARLWVLRGWWCSGTHHCVPESMPSLWHRRVVGRGGGHGPEGAQPCCKSGVACVNSLQAWRPPDLSPAHTSYTHAHAHTHARTHARTRTRAHTRTHTQTHTRTHKHTHMHTHTRTHTHTHTHSFLSAQRLRGQVAGEAVLQPLQHAHHGHLCGVRRAPS